MKWLNKLERKYHRFTIINLMTYIVGITSLVYVIQMFTSLNIAGLFSFVPSLVLKGQVWRIITFVFVPPAYDMLSFVLMMYFYYMLGNTLENEWGSFKFNIYYLFGIVGALIAGMLTGFATNVYINLSLFLAFAYIFPDMEILLFFVLPIKVKYLAYLDWAIFVINLVMGSLSTKAAIVASLINFFIFFGDDFITFIKNKKRYGSVQRNFKNEVKKYRR